jgi:hypothetical protein
VKKGLPLFHNKNDPFHDPEISEYSIINEMCAICGRKRDSWRVYHDRHYDAESFSAEEDKIQAHIRNLQKRLDNIRPGDDFTWKTVNDALDKCYQQLESLAKDYPED